MTLLYGHRGASIELPENTLPAFRRALELGADALESDVHLTRDGHVVLSHDPDGRRMAGVDRAIAASSLDEVKRWDAGWGFIDTEGGRPFAGQGIEVPTLEETLRAFPDIRLNLDIKQTTPGMVEPLLALLDRCKASSRVQLGSFSNDNVQAVLSAGYPGEVALSRDELVVLFFAPFRALRGWRAVKGGQRRAQVPVRAGPLRLGSARFIEKCHRLSVAVDYWTINDPELARRLLSRGADGIMTDDVATVLPAMPRDRTR